SDGEEAIKVRTAVKTLHDKYPNMVVDGELQANFALNDGLVGDIFPFSKLTGKKANVLIFPNLAAGNIAYKLLQEMGGRETIGPILLGMNKPTHVLQLGSSLREIVNMVTISVVDAQTRKKQAK
ncbi:MAG: phosphate acyltransferase, partial [Salibacteraceae bacterium]